MDDYEFIANFDIDEMILPSEEYNHLTIPQLLQKLDANFTDGSRLPSSYIFDRVYFPDAEDLNDETWALNGRFVWKFLSQKMNLL